MWLRNCWQVAAFADELAAGLLSRRFLGESVVLFRTADGPAALQDRCPHRLLPLSAGRQVGDEVQCGYHGMRFASDGRCVHIPGQEVIPGKARVKAYLIVERWRLIWIWMGDPALADPALVPELNWRDDPAWTCGDGYLYVEADYRLLGDNLLDLSHETYVHGQTIGNQEAESIAEYPVDIGGEAGKSVSAHREMLGIDPPPFMARALGSTNRIDRLQTAIYAPPGLHLTVAAMRPAGPKGAYPFLGRVLHLLTPETAHSTHYFWSIGRNYALADEQMTAMMREGVRVTFDEDKTVLELQQKALLADEKVAVPNLAIKLDLAPVRGRRLLEALVNREQADPTAVTAPALMATSPAVPLAGLAS